MAYLISRYATAPRSALPLSFSSLIRMQAAISRMAAASAPAGEAAWQAAALPGAITGDPWELEGALTALADVFSLDNLVD